METAMTRIHVHTFFMKYLKVMPSGLRDELLDLPIYTEYADVPSSIIPELDKALIKANEEEKKLSNCARRNNEGIRYEKEGNIAKAIEVYEENIAGDCYPASHSFDRLTILYRKQKDYQKELAVIDKAICVFTKHPDVIDKYKKRRLKALSLIEKNASKINNLS